MRLFEIAAQEPTLAELRANLADIEEQQEIIDDMTRMERLSAKDEAKAERKYAAYEAIKYVIENDIRSRTNPALRQGSIFEYEYDDDDIVAAVHLQIKDGVAEAKWLGSIEPGSGKLVLERALEIAKQQGAKKVILTAKFGSDDYYRKSGFRQTTQGESNPISGTGDSFEKDI